MNKVESHRSEQVARSWSLLMLRGLAAIGFGLLAWTRPDITIRGLVFVFGVYVLVDGVLAVFTALSGRYEQNGRWVLLFGGVIGIGVGIMTFVSPHVTALALLFYIAVWAVVEGVLEIFLAISLRRQVEGEWRLIFAGIVSVVFGGLLMARPGAGALAMLWMIAAYAVGFGILLVMLSFKLRDFGRHVAHA